VKWLRKMYVGVTPTSSEKSTRTWNGNVCDPVSRTTWSARDARLWRCHCSLRRFSSMTCITKWSLVRVTQKRVVDDIIKSGSKSFCTKSRDWRPKRSRYRLLGHWANKMQGLCYVFTISTYMTYLAFLLYCCISINFVCLLLNKNALRSETSAVMNYITQPKWL
jgi:hypothetical protein